MKLRNLISLILVLLSNCTPAKEISTSKIKSFDDIKTVTNKGDGIFEVLCKDGRTLNVDKKQLEKSSKRICVAPHQVTDDYKDTQIPILELNEYCDESTFTSRSYLRTDDKIINYFSCIQLMIKEDILFYTENKSDVLKLGITPLWQVKNILNQLPNELKYKSRPTFHHGIFNLANTTLEIIRAEEDEYFQGRIRNYTEFFRAISKVRTNPTIEAKMSLIYDSFFDLISPEWRSGILPFSNFDEHWRRELNLLVKKSTSPEVSFPRIQYQ